MIRGNEKNFTNYFFATSSNHLLKSKAIVTWYNSSNKKQIINYISKLKWGNLHLKEIDVNPPKNMFHQYYHKDKYLIPKLVYNY